MRTNYMPGVPPRAVAALTALTLAAAACSSSAVGPSATTGSTSGRNPYLTGTVASASLKGICPNPIIIQTGWFPEVEKPGPYALVGPNGSINTQHGYYYGTVGGVTVQVRAGGPFLGNESDVAVLYLHPDILLSEVNTDDQYVNYAQHPTVAVFAQLQKSPLGILWDPRHYHFTSIGQIGHGNARILKAGEDASSDLLVTQGFLRKSQFDFSYDGSPGRFVAAGGQLLLDDYADEDTYNYLHSFKVWGKPLNYLLLASAGYASYENSLVTTPQTLSSHTACFKKLVPMMQQAEVNFINNPGPLSAALIRYADALRSQTPLSAGLNTWSIRFMKSNGILANGTDGVLGSFDMNRVQTFIAHLGPVAKLENVPVKPGLGASDLVTNQFLDTHIHM